MIMLDNQDLPGHIKNDEAGDTGCSVFNDQEDENKESKRNSEIRSFLPRTMVDDELLEIINSLNSKQHETQGH